MTIPTTILSLFLFLASFDLFASSFPAQVSPNNGALISNEDPTFRWSAPRTPNTTIKSFELCLSVKSSLCKSAKFRGGYARDTRGNIVALKQKTRYFSYKVNKLPSSFLGKKLSWAVGICSTTSCQYRSFRTLSWKIPPMGVRTALKHLAADVYEIRWEVRRTNRKIPFNFDPNHLQKFVICIEGEGAGNNCVTNRDRNFHRYIKYTVEAKPSSETTKTRIVYTHLLYPRKYEEDRNLFTYLRNRRVRVTVHACTKNAGCTKQVHRTETTPYLTDSFMGALGNIATHPKCINCHTMDSQGAKYQEHIREKRFAPGTDVTNKQNCKACHNRASGFADNWVAPEAHRAYGDIPKIDVCRMIKYSNFRPHGYSMRLHLQIDSFVHWAVRKQGVSRNAYEAAVKRVVPDNNRDMECRNTGTGLPKDLVIDFRTQDRTCLPDARCF